MSTIFPREEKAEQIFDEILKNPHACERLKDTFFEAIPSAEESEGAGTDVPGTVFAAALFNAYENKDLSAFMMAVCNSSVFDLLRNSFLIPIRFNDKGVENPIFLTDENGDLLSESHQHTYAKKYKMFHKSLRQHYLDQIAGIISAQPNRAGTPQRRPSVAAFSGCKVTYFSAFCALHRHFFFLLRS